MNATRSALLVATPALLDPNFARTVVLLIEHGDSGSVGIVLNRPTETRVDAVVQGWLDIASAPEVAFIGGPVAPEGVIALAHATTETVPAFAHLFAGLGTVDLEAPPHHDFDALRIFVGYAGWGPGQLAAEIEEGAWFVVPSEPGDAWTPDPDALWHDVLRRQPGRLRMFANYPDDPATN